MIHHQFPDLTWLKKRIQLGFNNNHKFGWPNVILNVTTNSAYRPEILGPLSIFMNLSGESICRVSNHSVKIPESSYFLTNAKDYYTLEIESEKNIKTFNIHFGESFVENIFKDLIQPSDKLITDPFHTALSPINFYSKLYPKTVGLKAIILKIFNHQKEDHYPALLFEEHLSELAFYLLHSHREVLKEIEKLPYTKQSTKTEIFKRVNFAVDYMQSFYLNDLTLEELSSTACMSKFHFLRLFKIIFQRTPYQFIIELRLNKAKELLLNTDIPINLIATTLNFENLSSFSRLFYQRHKIYPNKFRQEHKSIFKLSVISNQLSH